ncbi:hypothetical protein BJ170DRAFT_183415 [Xylariales sp. AK1849]|nr:hypothetical protein BJ170DRAFT_183415 [Xylariales sp. AK1849]
MSFTLTASSTLLGPLTTTWTPPASCTVAMAACSTCTSGWLAQKCYSSNSVIDEASCWPPRSAGVADKIAPLMAWGVYSPGLECPSGYATACSYDGSKNTGDFEFLFRPETTETAIGCCPTGYSCAKQSGLIGQTCSAAIASSTIPTVTCESATSAHFSYQAVPWAVFENTTTKIMSTFYAYAPLFQLNYQSSDIASLSTTVTSEQSVPTDTSSKPAASSSATTVEASQGQQSDLSPGAVAGIVIGAALLVIALATISICVFRAQRRKRGQSLSHEGEMSSSQPISARDIHAGPFEVDANQHITWAQAELQGHAPKRALVSELDAYRAAELYS